MQRYGWDDIEAAIRQDDTDKRDLTLRTHEMHYADGMLVLPRRLRDEVGARYLPMTDTARGQLLQRIQVPADYEAQVREQGEVALANRMVNHGMSQLSVRAAEKKGQSDSWRLRLRGSTVRAALSEEFSVVDNHDLVDAMYGILVKNVPHQIRSFHMDDTSLWLKFTLDDEYHDPSGSFLKVGGILGNSEVGKRQVEFRPFLYRASCTNDAVYPVAGIRHKHRHIDMSRVQYSLTQSLATTLREGQGMINRALKLLGVKVAEPKEVIAALSKKQGLSKARTLAVVEAFKREPMQTRWGVFNAFTRSAQTLVGDERVSQEEFAGTLINLQRWPAALAA